MQLLMAGRFEDPVEAYGYVRTIFEEAGSGERPGLVSITPSSRHVGVTHRDTLREGFKDAVRAAHEEGYPVLVRGSGGGAIAADEGTFGFSIIRPSTPEKSRQGMSERYDEAAALVLGAFSRLGVEDAEPGEVQDEFCPGDHSVRVGGFENGMKLVGIAQRVTKKVTSVGGIVLVHGEKNLARVLERVYAALNLPFRPESVGSLHRAGSSASVEDVVQAFAEEARQRYGATPTPVGERTLEKARLAGDEFVARP